jgi:capsular polysaccharide transport system permease protein
MTTPIKANRFRIRRPDPVNPAPTQAAAEMLFEVPDDGFGPAPFPTAAKKPETPPAPPQSEIDAIRREGLTGRQLRLARRMAQLNYIRF